MALTAFVTIALHHGLAVFQDNDAEQLKPRVVMTPTCLPFSGPSPRPPALRLSPQEPRCPAPRHLHPHCLLGNFHIQR